MRVIVPKTIDGSTLVNSNIPEPDPSAGEVEFIDPNASTGADPKTVIGGSLQGVGRVVSVTMDKFNNIIIAQLETTSSTSGVYIHKFSSEMTLIGWTLIDFGSENNFQTDKFAVTSGGETIDEVYLVRLDPFDNKVQITHCACRFTNDTTNYSISSSSFEPYLSQGGINVVYSATCTPSSARDRITVLYKLSNGKIRVATIDTSTATILYENDCAAISSSKPTGYNDRYQIFSRAGSYLIFSRDSSRNSIINMYSNLTYASRTKTETIEKLSGTLENTLHGINTANGYKLLSDEGVTIGNFTAYDVNANFIYGEAETYPAGTIFVKSSTHRKYQAVVDTFIDPADGVNTIPPQWIDIGPTNKYAAFDGVISNAASYQNEIIYNFKPNGQYNSISGFNITGATEVNITIKSSHGSVVYNNTFTMRDNSQVVDWYSYYFSPIIERTQFTVTDLPAYGGSTATLSIMGSDSVSVGEVVVGSQINLGVTQYGVSLQGLDFSQKNRDEFGNFEIIRRGTSKLVDYDVKVDRGLVNYVARQLDQLSTVPCVWVGSDEFNDETTAYGYHKDYLVTIDTPSICSVTISVEGLV